jgi:hypothetical protein
LTVVECIQLYLLIKVSKASIEWAEALRGFVGNMEDLYDLLIQILTFGLIRGMIFTTQEFNLSNINRSFWIKGNQREFSNIKLNSAIESYIVLRNERETMYKYTYYKENKKKIKKLM